MVSYTTLICGYLKRGRFEDALRVFHEMPERNVVSWNAMVGGCSQTGHNEEAVNFFIGMLREGFIPNESTFPCVICAAANIASLGIGKSFHINVVLSQVTTLCCTPGNVLYFSQIIIVFSYIYVFCHTHVTTVDEFDKEK